MLNTNAITLNKFFPWFKNWFDSVYYHKLYSNRNEQEAVLFIDNLVTLLPPAASVIDVGCGTGRHSKRLAEKGFHVTGIDLSSYSLQQARQHNSNNLQFFRHDMRHAFGKERFDVVLNLFTSFGYFETKAENLQVIENMHNTLKAGGILVIDYLNMHYINRHLVVNEQKEIDGIVYDIDRWTDDDFFYKHISVKHESIREPLEYTEQVSKFGPKHFESMLGQFNFEIQELYGDYQLNDFDEQHSPRLIIVAIKK